MSHTPGYGAASPAPFPNRRGHDHRDHMVQFYVEDTSLVDALAQFIGSALATGEAAVVIATPAHQNALMARLRAQRIDVASPTQQGRYIALDAGETLEKVTLDEWPNAALFVHVVGEIIDRFSTGVPDEHPRVAVFGEMVALLLDQGKSEAAIRLEQLWDELARKLS